VKDIDFRVDFVAGFGRKNQLSPQYVHIVEFRNFQF